MAKNPTVVETGPGILTLGELQSAKSIDHQVLSCTLQPETKSEDPIPVLSGGFIPGNRTEKWKLTGKMAADLGAVESVTEWLFDHRGETMPFKFTPNNQAKTSFSGKVVVEATAIGGDVGKREEVDFEFVVVGIPTKAKA